MLAEAQKYLSRCLKACIDMSLALYGRQAIRVGLHKENIVERIFSISESTAMDT